MNKNKLPLDFYLNNTKKVAQSLLGKTLVRMYRNHRISGEIVETEAYLGATDEACHSRNGLKTKRNLSMYLPGGHAYIYFIYGMYYCMNVVTKNINEPEAVLIRAIEPLEGLSLMNKFRNFSSNLTNGPGKLAMAMKIDRKLDGSPLNGDKIFIEESNIIYKKSDIIISTRIGISKNNEAHGWPLRFHVKGNKFVSK